MKYLLTLLLLCTPLAAQERGIFYQPGQRYSAPHHPPHETRWAWIVHDLTWHIDQYPRGLEPADVDATFREAFSAWAAVCNMRFTQVQNAEDADIRMTFDWLGGFNGNLAEMFYPGVNWGDEPREYTHGTFNIDYPWAFHGLDDLEETVVHEIGHALGFFHDDDPTSAMYPFANGWVYPNEADAELAQEYYGRRIVATPKRPRPGIRPWSARGAR